MPETEIKLLRPIGGLDRRRRAPRTGPRRPRPPGPPDSLLRVHVSNNAPRLFKFGMCAIFQPMKSFLTWPGSTDGPIKWVPSLLKCPVNYSAAGRRTTGRMFRKRKRLIFGRGPAPAAFSRRNWS